MNNDTNNHNHVTNANLHFQIIKWIIEKGYAPTVDDLTSILKANEDQVINGLNKLQDYHGVVLHPNEPKVWVMHPFSLAPTNFFVQSSRGQWWGNCAWCSLGIAALLHEDVKITTTIGAEIKQIEINVVDGEVQEKGLFIHFPIPMAKAWDNVIYTCSNMLVFENEKQIDDWAKRHDVPKGDIQPIDNIWQFSKIWYGRHLDPNWTKWSIDDAKQLFTSFKLEGPLWELDGSSQRF